MAEKSKHLPQLPTFIQLKSMLELQNSMNSIVNPEWKTAGYDWYRAMMVEAVEAVEHHGWKWWKKQTPDMPQLKMELIDIWHFALSALMVKTQYSEDVIAQHIIGEVHKNREYISNTIYVTKSKSLLEILDLFIEQSAKKYFDIPLFDNLLAESDLDWEELYVTYIGKNCLNIFRQKNGYKSGAYVKDWSACPLKNPIEGKAELEDNDHLHEIISLLDKNSETFIEDIQKQLKFVYEIVLLKNKMNTVK